MQKHPLAGVYAAAVTPFNQQGQPDLHSIPKLIDFFATRGCHGALLLGTTGEGPSFSSSERKAILNAAAQVRQDHPDFHLLAGTGTPSLDETIQLNQTAFDLGYDAVVVLPPYFFRGAGEEGLFAWYSKVIEASVPRDRRLLVYHFPAMSGINLSPSFMIRLQDKFPDRFGGLKDSSGDLAHARAMVQDLEYRLVLVGNDTLFSQALQSGASGCITAPANLISPRLRRIWDAHQKEESDPSSQLYVDQAREILENYKPFPAVIKGLLAELHNFPRWPVQPPLSPLSSNAITEAARDLLALLIA